MNIFSRNGKLYLGPISENPDRAKQVMNLYDAGVACIAGPGNVEVYLTVPDQIQNRIDLSNKRLHSAVV